MPAHRSRQLLQSMVLAVGLVAFGSGAVHACNVPVFRYALEHWRPDPYRVVLLHRGPLGDSDQALIATLQEQQEQSQVNIAIRTVDVSVLDDAADRESFATLGDAQLPWLLVQYPAHLRLETPIWTGPLNSETLTHLADSPLRREIVRRLVDGQNAVWLMLETGDSSKDDSAAALLEAELTTLQQSLKLPVLTDSPEDMLLGGPPLRLAFSVLRVPRGDRAEQALVAMLLASEPDLAELTEPLVFPVFGRGRALLPLVGAGITAENIQGTAAFLVGACSCQVKELNPGFDLLLAADWNALLSLEGVSLAAIGSQASSASDEPELVPIPSGPPPAAPSSSAVASTSQPPPVVDRTILQWTAVGVLVLVSVLLIMLRWR